MKSTYNFLLFFFVVNITLSQNYKHDYWKEDYVKGDFLKAKTKINNVLEQNPYLSHLLFYRAMCNKNLQNYTESLADINKYLQNTDNLNAQLEKGNLLFELGFNEKAFKVFNEIKLKHGDLEQLKIPMVRYHLYKNQPDEAKMLIRELYSKHPNNAEILWLISITKIHDNNSNEALVYLQNSIKNGLQNIQKLEEIVEYSKLKNQYELSLFALNECIKISPNNPVYYYKKQTLLELLNKPEEAKKFMTIGNNLLNQTTTAR